MPLLLVRRDRSRPDRLRPLIPVGHPQTEAPADVVAEYRPAPEVR